MLEHHELIPNVNTLRVNAETHNKGERGQSEDASQLYCTSLKGGKSKVG